MIFPVDGFCTLKVMNGSESGGRNLLDQVQVGSRIVCDAKILGLCVTQVTTSIEKRKRAEDMFSCLQVTELSREWQGDFVVVQWDMKKAFDHVDHRAVFKAVKLQRCEFALDGMIDAIWNGSVHESVLAKREAEGYFTRISSYFHNDHGNGAIWITRK